MIALDSNVLVRLLIEDDPIQANRARRLLKSTEERGEQCFISDPVLCEVEWVLDSVYGASRRDIATAIQHILMNDLFVVEDSASALRALDLFSRGKGDFSDSHRNPGSETGSQDDLHIRSGPAQRGGLHPTQLIAATKRRRQAQMRKLWGRAWCVCLRKKIATNSTNFTKANL